MAHNLPRLSPPKKESPEWCLQMMSSLVQLLNRWRCWRPGFIPIRSYGSSTTYPGVLLVGGLEHVSFSHLLGTIIPTDELIFFKGVGQPPTSLGLVASLDRYGYLWSLQDSVFCHLSGEAQVLRALTPKAETHGSLGGDTRGKVRRWEFQGWDLEVGDIFWD